MARPDYVALAKEAVGNHRRFESFSWYDRPEDSDQWTIVYTSNRDSGILEMSNAAAIARALAPYIRREWVREESHSHWAVGHVDGYAIRVYRPDGKVSRAFRAWCDLNARLEDYPVLDDDDFSRREWEETLEYWEGMSRRERIKLCAERGDSIFAARRDSPPDGAEMYIRDHLNF